MLAPPKLSLVLPAWNEAASLPAVIASYRASYEAARAMVGALGDDFELIIVDNGSSDGTAQVVAALRARYGEWLRLVRVAENQGYGGGICAGLAVARGEFVGFSHADEQTPAEAVFRAWAKLRPSGQLQLVKGVRRGRGLRDYLFSRAYEVVIWLLLGRRLFEVNAQPKVFSRALVPAILLGAPSGFSFDLHVLLTARRQGSAFVAIPVAYLPRLRGSSKWAYSLRSKMRHSWQAFRYILGVSVWRVFLRA